MPPQKHLFQSIIVLYQREPFLALNMVTMSLLLKRLLFGKLNMEILLIQHKSSLISLLAAGRAKWGQKSGLVMLLPHGHEGQGPEHSSGRLERFLLLAAENNWTIANLTSAAQYFHILRRQAAYLKERKSVRLSL